MSDQCVGPSVNRRLHTSVSSSIFEFHIILVALSEAVVAVSVLSFWCLLAQILDMSKHSPSIMTASLEHSFSYSFGTFGNHQLKACDFVKKDLHYSRYSRKNVELDIIC